MTVVRFSSPFSKRGLSSQTFIGNKDLIPKTSDLIKKKNYKFSAIHYKIAQIDDVSDFFPSFFFEVFLSIKILRRVTFPSDFYNLDIAIIICRSLL